MVKVKIREKGGQQQDYQFDQSEVTIGRMKENDIVLPKGNVSKKHARIMGRNGSLLIDDLNSTNGTYVNGRKVTNEHEVSESDKIYIGDFILQVEPGQRGDAPPKAPPSPPGGQDSSPPSPPGGPPGGGPSGGPSTGGPSAGGPSAGGPSGGPSTGGPSAGGSSGGPSGRDPNDSLGALDEKYGSGPGGPDTGQNTTPDDSRGRSNTRRDPAVQGQQESDRGASSDRGRRSSRGSQSGGGHPTQGEPNPRGAKQSSPGSSPGSSPSSRPGQSSPGSSPGSAPSRPGSSGSGSGPRAANSSGPAPAPDESSPDRPRRSTRTDGDDDGDASGRGRSGRRRRSRSGSGEHSADPAKQPSGRRDSDSVRISDNESQLASGRRKRVRTAPSVPSVDFDEEFDTDFHRAQRDVAEALLEEINLEDLPVAYPPREADREEYESQIAEIVEDLDPPAERGRLVDLVTDECVGLGPLEAYLDDPDVNAVHVNAYDRIVLERDDETVIAPRAFSLPEMLETVASRLIGTRDPDILNDGFRFGDGTRGTVIRPPLAVDGPAITLVKPDSRHAILEELQKQEALSEGMQTFLTTAVEAGRTILVASPHESERRAVLEALGREIPEGTRLISVEETAQLDLPQQSWVPLEVSRADEFEVEQLMDAATDLEADRIVLETCDKGGAYQWIGAAATGARGSLAALDGLTASDALTRLQAACQLDSRQTNPRGLREQIAQGIDLVVVVDRRPDGGALIRQITEVQGIDLDAFRLNDVFYFREEGSAGAFHPTGYIPLFFEDLQQMGEDVDLSIFRD